MEKNSDTKTDADSCQNERGTRTSQFSGSVRLLRIKNCYQCFHRETSDCVCLLTDKLHPKWEDGIPDWCPLQKAPND